MACDLKPSIERMTEKLILIFKISSAAALKSRRHKKDGLKYMTLSKAIGKISVLVRDNSNVREYWYAKFVEEGVLKQCDGEGAVATHEEER